MPARTASRFWWPSAEVTAAHPEAPSVSVVDPTRDRPGDLARCLRALAAQDPPPLEVIVVDDGSRDPAAAAAAAAASASGSRCIRLEGEGPAAARNAGAAAARGEVVCFLAQ